MAITLNEATWFAGIVLFIMVLFAILKGSGKLSRLTNIFGGGGVEDSSATQPLVLNPSIPQTVEIADVEYDVADKEILKYSSVSGLWKVLRYYFYDASSALRYKDFENGNLVMDTNDLDVQAGNKMHWVFISDVSLSPDRKLIKENEVEITRLSAENKRLNNELAELKGSSAEYNKARERQTAGAVHGEKTIGGQPGDSYPDDGSSGSYKENSSEW